MRLLVTGTSGFIGTSLCERMSRSRGFEVVGLDRRPPTESFHGVVYREVDLLNKRAVLDAVRDIRPEAIVHLAAQARVDPSLIESSPTYADNVIGTVNLIAGAEGLGTHAPTFLYASSETVYGSCERYPTDEGTPLNPLSPYAASKAACELLVSRAFPATSIILRSGMGYGPRSDPSAQVVGRFITRALRGDSILFPAGPGTRHPTRDVNFVGNFLDGIELALKSGASGVFNVASGREISILDLAELVIQEVGRGEILKTDHFRYRPMEEGGRTWLDIKKAHDTFGYSPSVGLDAGLRLSSEWYQLNPSYFSNSPSLGAADVAPTAR